MSVNKVIIVGRLGGDPELRQTQAGQSVCNFNVATSESWAGQDGQRKERTEWHRIVVWGRLAELCSQYLTKGREVFAEGKIQTREWEDRDGNKRYTTEIVASEVKSLGSAQGGSHAPSNDRPETKPAKAGGGRAAKPSDHNEDDIPF